MRSSVVLAVAVFAVAGVNATSVEAADLYGSVKDTYVPEYVPPPVFRWTGFYVGLQTGYVWGNADHVFSDPNPGGSSDPDGWIGGGHMGFNWQSGQWVFGVEADIEGGNVDGSYGGPLTAAAFELNWQGSLRGRLGLAADRTLFYVTAGWAFADADIAGFSNIGPNATAFSDTLNGWTLGGGIEQAVTNNFTVRLEYRYTDFGSASGRLLPDNVDIMKTDLDTHAIRVGASWKF